MDKDVAIVTGAGSGIGLALAECLIARGESVVLVDRDGDAVDAAARELSVASGGASAVATTANITVPGALRRAVEMASELGYLRTACLNAGVTTTGTNVWETPIESVELMFAVNLRGLFESLREVVPAMLAHGKPARILITASMAGLVASPTSSAYSASKAGAIAVAKALRTELSAVAPQISVTVLTPGMVQTNLMRTSAAQHGSAATMAPELVEGAHDALNTFGLDPAETARVALDDLASGRFWSLPLHDDPFAAALRDELDEIRALR
jgi:NAD(P)-dependent dehydrogenase (short-subunit alcohol dehydrogenase family)